MRFGLVREDFDPNGSHDIICTREYMGQKLFLRHIEDLHVSQIFYVEKDGTYFYVPEEAAKGREEDIVSKAAENTRRNSAVKIYYYLIYGLDLVLLDNSPYGGEVLLMSDMTDAFNDYARAKNSNFWILPSSIHELLLLPFTVGIDPAMLQSYIIEVNESELLPSEILSNSLYYYDRTNKKVSLYEP